MKNIKVEELRAIFQKIIEKLKSEGYEELNFNKDFYRIIPTEKWDSYNEDLAQEASLFDDIYSLKLLNYDSKRTTTYVDFDRLASILRAISQNNNPV